MSKEGWGAGVSVGQAQRCRPPASLHQTQGKGETQLNLSSEPTQQTPPTLQQDLTCESSMQRNTQHSKGESSIPAFKCFPSFHGENKTKQNIRLAPIGRKDAWREGKKEGQRDRRRKGTRLPSSMLTATPYSCEGNLRTM